MNREGRELGTVVALRSDGRGAQWLEVERRVSAAGKSKGSARMLIPLVEQYVDAVLKGQLFDPVLSVHLKDGWTAVKPIHGYLQHDEDSAGWAEVIQWVNPACPPPPEFELRNLPAQRQ